MENPQQNINKLIPTMYKKKYTPLPSGTYSRCARLIQHLKNQSCNPYIKKEKDSYLINWCQNILQNSIPIHDLKTILTPGLLGIERNFLYLIKDIYFKKKKTLQ